jgi:MFS family permease
MIHIDYQFLQIAEKYGRKKALITMAVPQMAGWVLIYFAKNPIYLIASRFLHGFAGGGELAGKPHRE